MIFEDRSEKGEHGKTETGYRFDGLYPHQSLFPPRRLRPVLERHPPDGAVHLCTRQFPPGILERRLVRLPCRVPVPPSCRGGQDAHSLTIMPHRRAPVCHHAVNRLLGLVRSRGLWRRRLWHILLHGPRACRVPALLRLQHHHLLLDVSPPPQAGDSCYTKTPPFGRSHASMTEK